MKRFLAACALTAAIVACKSSTGPTISISGSWAGTADGHNWAVTFADSAGVVVGGGLLDGSLTLNMSGSHSGSSLNLSVTAPGFSAATYAATVNSATQISGTLSGSGFNGTTLTLIKL